MGNIPFNDITPIRKIKYGIGIMSMNNAKRVGTDRTYQVLSKEISWKACGLIRIGEDKDGLDDDQKHGIEQYICYECGAFMDRDENAVADLLALSN